MDQSAGKGRELGGPGSSEGKVSPPAPACPPCPATWWWDPVPPRLLCHSSSLYPQMPLPSQPSSRSQSSAPAPCAGSWSCQLALGARPKRWALGSLGPKVQIHSPTRSQVTLGKSLDHCLT